MLPEPSASAATDWRSLCRQGRFAAAQAALAETCASQGLPPAEATELLAELEERWGDALWFHDQLGAGPHYRAALAALLPRQGPPLRDAAQAQARQAAWSRVAAKLLHGTAPAGRRRPGADGRAHPAGLDPAPALAPAPHAAPCDLAVEVAPELAPAPACSAADGEAPVTPEPEPEPLPAAAPPAGAATEPPLRPYEPSQYRHLRPGQHYRVEREFTDFDGRVLTLGTIVQYLDYSYFPYDDGLTLRLHDGLIRLCGLFPEQEHVKRHLDAYLREVS